MVMYILISFFSGAALGYFANHIYNHRSNILRTTTKYACQGINHIFPKKFDSFTIDDAFEYQREQELVRDAYLKGEEPELQDWRIGP